MEMITASGSVIDSTTQAPRPVFAAPRAPLNGWRHAASTTRGTPSARSTTATGARRHSIRPIAVVPRDRPVTLASVPVLAVPAHPALPAPPALPALPAPPAPSPPSSPPPRPALPPPPIRPTRPICPLPPIFPIPPHPPAVPTAPLAHAGNQQREDPP